MSTPQSHVDLAEYLLGTLGPEEFRRAEEHLDTCDPCRREVAEYREVEAALDAVPPELFVDGPDPDAEFLLERTLRKARAESRSRRAGRVFAVAAGLVVLLALAIGGGVVLGRSSGSAPIAAPAPSTSATGLGSHSGSVTDPSTGARMAATVTDFPGWVRVDAQVSGLKEGEKCRLLVVGKHGSEIAGSWVIGPKAAENGLPVEGYALISPEDLTAVQIVTTDGRTLVSVPV